MSSEGRRHAVEDLAAELADRRPAPCHGLVVGRRRGRPARLDGQSRRYVGDGRVTVALDAVSLGVRAGSFVAVMGATGSGKSTLPHCAAGLDRPSSGTVRLVGSDISSMRERALTRLRRDHVGFGSTTDTVGFAAPSCCSIRVLPRWDVALPG